MKNNSAFSLFELLLVTSLILIVVTIIVPVRVVLNDFYLKNEIERLAIFCRYIQMRAIASAQQHELLFDLQSNLCSCKVSLNESLVHSLENGVKFGFIPGVLGSPSNPVQLIEKPINLDKPMGVAPAISDLCIRFYSDGKMTAGSVYFVDKLNKNMGALTCSPSRVSYIRKYCYSGRKWVLL